MDDRAGPARSTLLLPNINLVVLKTCVCSGARLAWGGCDVFPAVLGGERDNTSSLHKDTVKIRF
ncbi:hypothetical protein E2C01_030227 [Portunus trituberculatus]|uniref:Uncharacterized protein n=1 Tax=Portunus trituberculatus TaxID=210409 RepID=A0A5B7EUS8_PORTR|nr:hypothetical protein [Portunus trituberculatus]